MNHDLNVLLVRTARKASLSTMIGVTTFTSRKKAESLADCV